MLRIGILLIGLHVVLAQNQYENPSGNISTRFGGKYLGYYLATLGAAFGRPIVIQAMPIQTSRPPATQDQTATTRSTLAIPDPETQPSVANTPSPFPTAPPTGASPFPTAPPASPFPTAPPTASPFPTAPPASPFPTAPPSGISSFPTAPPTGVSFPTAPPTSNLTIVLPGNFPVTNTNLPVSSFPTAPPSSPIPTAQTGIDLTNPTAPSTSFPTGVITSFDQQLPTTVSLAQNTAPGTIGQDGEAKCGCVPANSCTTRPQGVNTRVVTSGPQQVQCPGGMVYCCTTTAQFACGFQNVIAGVNPGAGQANLGEFPWAAIIFMANGTYVGGATIVSNRHVITVAHNVLIGLPPQGFIVRVGEWDSSGAYEPVRHQDVPVRQIVPHPNYDRASLRNDIAIVALGAQLPFLVNPLPQVNSICMPGARDQFAGRCFVMGWGRDQFNGRLQEVIKKVDVPIVPPAECQARIRAAGVANWNLDPTSMICAGGEPNRDACVGDGGNALACGRNGQFYVAGIAVGGIRCGLANVPGLYTNIVSYATWINANIAPPVEIVPRTG